MYFVISVGVFLSIKSLADGGIRWFDKFSAVKNFV